MPFTSKLFSSDADRPFSQVSFLEDCTDAAKVLPKLIKNVMGSEVPYGSLLAFMFRRFGHPNFNLRTREIGAGWQITTASPDLILEVVPSPSGKALQHFRFLVNFDALVAGDDFRHVRQRRWLKAILAKRSDDHLPDWMPEWQRIAGTGANWRDSLMVIPERQPSMPKEVHQAAVQFRTDLIAAYGDIKAAPRLVERGANWRKWADADPLKTLVSAANEALVDLMRGVQIRDGGINPKGRMENAVYTGDQSAPVAAMATHAISPELDAALMKQAADGAPFEIQPAGYKEHADYYRAYFSVDKEERGLRDDAVHTSVFGGRDEQCDYGQVFAYMVNRFGWPNACWDDYKVHSKWVLSTPLPHMRLIVTPHFTSISSLEFSFVVEAEPHRAIRDFDQASAIKWRQRAADWKAQQPEPEWMQQWKDLMASPPEGEYQWNVDLSNLSACTSHMFLKTVGSYPGGEDLAQVAFEWAQEYLLAYLEIEPAVARLVRGYDWNLWADDDPLKPLAVAASAALNELLVPIKVGSVWMNIKKSEHLGDEPRGDDGSLCLEQQLLELFPRG